MNLIRLVPLWVAWIGCAALLTLSPQGVHASELKLEAILIWATHDETSPDPKHKKISRELKAKISKGPYKWKNYFEVSRQQARIKPRATSRLRMSKKCLLEIRNLSDGRIEVKLHGDNQLVSRQIEPMPAGATLILGGEAENETAWLIVLTNQESEQ